MAGASTCLRVLALAALALITPLGTPEAMAHAPVHAATSGPLDAGAARRPEAVNGAHETARSPGAELCPGACCGGSNASCCVSAALSATVGLSAPGRRAMRSHPPRSRAAGAIGEVPLEPPRPRG